MPDLQSLLSDPNYTEANAATKKAIFDKWSAQDDNYTGANDATKSAIRKKFGVESGPALPTALQPSMNTGIPGPRVGAENPFSGVTPEQIQATNAARAAVPPQSFGQQFYSQIRGPLETGLETAGAIGGAALATPSGPGGMALGGGLGYGMARQGMRALDIAMGRSQPMSFGNELLQAGTDVATGAAMELGGQVAAPWIAKGVGKIGGVLADIKGIPERKANQIVLNALGPDLEAVKNALAAAKGTDLSAAQATADITSPTWQALIARATARDPRFLMALEKSQGEASLNALANITGGTTATGVKDALAQAKWALNDAMASPRVSSLARANLGKVVADLEAKSASLGAEAAGQVAKVRRLVELGNFAEAHAQLDLINAGLPTAASKYTYKGELGKMADQWASQAANASLDLGRGAQFADAAAKGLRAQGIKPLETDSLLRSIREIAANPEFAGDDVLAGSLKNIAEDVAKWTDSGGIIDAKALDAIRKNSVNAAIAQLRPGMDASSQQKLAASVLGNVKPLIVDAIEGAGGTGYRQYLADYAAGMQKINAQKLSGEAQRLWKTDKDAFVRLVQGEDPKAVEKIMGPGNYDIAQQLSSDVLDTLQQQAKKRLTEVSIREQTNAGQDALKQLLLDNTSKLRLPSYLSAVAATTNKALNILENKIGAKTMQVLTDALQTPEGARNLIDHLPAEERIRVLKLISDPSQWGKAGKNIVRATTISGTNALAPEDYSQNALANPTVRVVDTGVK